MTLEPKENGNSLFFPLHKVYINGFYFLIVIIFMLMKLFPHFYKINLNKVHIISLNKDDRLKNSEHISKAQD